jgi:hypothetical protein
VVADGAGRPAAVARGGVQLVASPAESSKVASVAVVAKTGDSRRRAWLSAALPAGIAA